MKTPERLQNAFVGIVIVTFMTPALLVATGEMLPDLLPLTPINAAFLLMTCGVLLASLQSAWGWVEDALGHKTTILPVLYIIGTIGALASGAPFNVWDVVTGLLFCIATGSLAYRFIEWMKKESRFDLEEVEKQKNDAQTPPLEIPTRLLMESIEEHHSTLWGLPAAAVTYFSRKVIDK